MNEKDPSQDVELLMWSRYLSDFVEATVCDISETEWKESIPLAGCLRVSTNLTPVRPGTHLFKTRDAINSEMVDLLKDWMSKSEQVCVGNCSESWKYVTY